MRFLRTNTAVIITVGPFYDKTDGVTIETALTITNERITLTADTDAGSAPTNILDNVTGATSGTANDLNYITGNDAGMMQLELAAADVNRLGRMFLSITDAANHVPVFHEFTVLPQAIYDWLIAGTIVPLPANVTQLLGTAVATPATAGILDANVKNINNVAAATPGAAGGVFIAGTNAATTVTTALTTTFTGNLTGSVASVTGAVGSVTGAVGSVTGAVGSVTGNVGGNVVGTVASVVAIPDASLGIIDAGTAQSATGTTLVLRAAAAFANDEIIGATVVIVSATAGAGQARVITDYVGASDTATVDAWTTTPTGTIVYKIFGSAPASVSSPIPATIVTGGIVAASFAAGAIDAAAIAANAIGASELATDAVAEIADQVWDEAIAGHLAGGSTGAALNAAGGAGDPWATAIPGAYGAGTAGKILGDNINATISSRASQTSLDAVDDLLDTEVAAIKTETASIQADTNDIQTRLPAALVSGRMDASVGAMAANVMTAAAAAADLTTELQAGLATAAALTTIDDFLDTEIAAIKAVTDLLPNGGALSNLDAAVSTRLATAGYTVPPTAIQNADAHLDRDMAAGADTQARSPRNALRAIRNKVSRSGATVTVTKEDDTTSAWTATITTDVAAVPITVVDPA